MRILKITLPLLFTFLLVSCLPEPFPEYKPGPLAVTPTVLPHIYIVLENASSINTKDDFINATIKIDGKEMYEDYEGTTGIRGRGNSTWEMPKKPYRIKLDSKASLFGLSPYKNWVLLADYIDGTSLYNSVPFKAGELLEIPYTHNPIPVELTINGVYQGCYTFMEHKEVGPGRIDIGDNGLLLELDTHFDEDWQFITDNYELPIMIQYPKSKNMTNSMYADIVDDFQFLEDLIYSDEFPNNDYLDYFDDISFINYLIVFQLTGNQEINHPKSVYMNKPENGKYRMGILWDFDWAYGYNPEANIEHYDLMTANYPLFWDANAIGTKFFTRIMEDPHMQSLFQQRWHWFKTNKYNELREHVKAYSDAVGKGYDNEHAIWGKRNSTGDPEQDLHKLLTWLDARVNYIDTYVASLQ